MKGQPTDHFRLDDHGSILVLTPLSDEARAWCEANIAPEPNMGAAYAGERRAVNAILEALAGEFTRH